MISTVLCFLFVSVCYVQCAREEDRVDYVPGLDPQPEFNNYAGYLSASGTRKFFYWFVESEGNPAEDPVVLWLNGGPGCSSLTGKLVELGPWRVLPDGSGLEWFEHRWNKIANIIFMESPQCVGYSYAEDEDCSSGDNEVAYDNHLALRDFFEGFPEYRDNDFYVTGESYAGYYVPILSARIVDDADFNFKGMAIGNAVCDNRIMDNSLIWYAWARGLFGSDLYDGLLEDCCEDRNATKCDFVSQPSPQCLIHIARVNVIVWSSGLNPYNLYDECFGGAPDARGIYSENDNSVRMVLPDVAPLLTNQARDEYLQLFKDKMRETDVYGSIPCTDTSDRDIYLNNPEVREALHVPSFVQPWEACSDEVSANYDREYNSVFAEYEKVWQAGHKILVFNGDLDMACNHLGNMWFVEELNKEELHPFQEWFYNNEEDGSKQIAGYVLQHERLNFVSVKGAGHFVPTDKPWPAYIMWEKYLNDEEYP